MDNREDLQEIKQILTDAGIEYRYHSWTTMPSDHVFATWFVPSEDFDGSDERAEYVRYTVEVYLYFRKYVSEDSDLELMEHLEQEFRGAAKYSKRSGYDSERDLFWSRYTFTFIHMYKE